MKKLSLLVPVVAAVLAPALPVFAQTTPTGTLNTFASQPSGYGGTMNTGMIQASDGNFYSSPSTTSYVFRISFAASPAGTVSTLKGQLASACGEEIEGGLIEGPDGDLYGISISGGTNSNGVFFSYSLATKTCTALYNFSSVDGVQPSPLTIGADGNFYGVFRTSGANNYGDVFRITPAGVFTDLYDFTGGTDGGYPQGGVLQASDGNWYGATSYGVSGANAGGPYQLVPGATVPWQETVLLSFSGATGYDPSQMPSEWTDGNVYGTLYGGGNGYGTIWESDLFDNNPNADYFSFPGGNSQPQSNLFLAGDGNFYTALSNTAGPDDGGFVVYNPGTGAFTNLTNFVPGTTSVTPIGPVIQATDGNFYGTANGGANNSGAYYQVVVSPAVKPTITVTPSTTTASAGAPITINWKVTEVTSDTAAQCYAYPYAVAGGFNVATTTAGSWGGKLSSTITNFTMSGSASVTPSADGSYVYAVECQGKITGYTPVVTVSGVAAAPTSTTLKASATTISYGSQEVFTATVKETSGTGIPTGTVTFSAVGQTLATTSVNGSGVATLTANAVGYGPNNYPIIATYNGDSGNAKSTSNTVYVDLLYGTATTLTVTPTTGTTSGTTFTLTAKVAQATGPGSGTTTPGGQVAFYVSGLYLGSANLSNGTATVSGSSKGYPAGTYSATAVYQGSNSENKSTSNAVTITLTK